MDFFKRSSKLDTLVSEADVGATADSVVDVDEADISATIESSKEQ